MEGPRASIPASMTRAPPPRPGKSPGPETRNRTVHPRYWYLASQTPLPGPRLEEPPRSAFSIRPHLAPRTKRLYQTRRPRHSLAQPQGFIPRLGRRSRCPTAESRRSHPSTLLEDTSLSGGPCVLPLGRLWGPQAQAGGVKFWVLNSGPKERCWSQPAAAPAATAGVGEREGCGACVCGSVHI